LAAEDWNKRTVNIRGREIPVWPEGQEVSRLEESLVLVTRFANVPHYHPELIRKILEQESNSRYKANYAQGGWPSCWRYQEVTPVCCRRRKS